MKQPLLGSVLTAIMPFAALAIAASPASAQTLEQSVIRGLQNNPEVGIALNRFQAREDSIGVARSGFLPRVDLQAGYGYEVSDNENTRVTGEHSEDLWREELSINLRQMLFDGHRTKSDVERASAEAQAERYNLQDTAENLALRTAEVFLDTLNSERIQALAENNLASHQRIRDQIQLRTDSGIGSSSDLSQVQGRLARAESNLIAAQNNLQDSISNFVRVVGERPDQLAEPASPRASLPADVQQAEAIALAEHPVLLASAEDVRAASEKIRVEESANYPQLSFELGATANHDQDGVEAHDNDLTAMLRVSYNLYSGGRTRSSIAQASNEMAEARDVQQNGGRQVIEGLTLAWNAYQSLDRQLPYLNTHVEESRKTLEAYTRQFELGRRSLMDLLDTENEVFEARKAYLNAEKDWLFAQFRILNATGRLLSTLKVDLPGR